MGYEIENNCVGCPQGCIRCGRDHQKVYFCDECGDYTEKLYVHKRKELCWKCYKAKFNEKFCDECDDTLCGECGMEADFLYKIEGNEWACEECLRDMAERVEIE